MPSLAPPDGVIRDARAAVAGAGLLDDTDAIRAASDAWQSSAVIGLDTEFVREKTFRAQPGLVQISDGRSVWLLDVVACPDIPALGRTLENENVTKVLHSVGEDLEVLNAIGGTWPAPLFDTQVAAAMLGLPLQCRYEHLVRDAFGVELEGGKARNDWRRRPLPPALLRYAAEDVIWLPRLKSRLEELLDRADRLVWLREDCRRIVVRARAGDDAPPLSRVKGAGRLEDGLLARLDVLSRWRERTAAQRDLPRRFVLSDEALIELARAHSGGALGAALEALHSGQQRRYGKELEAELGSVDPGAFERPAWMFPLTNEQREQIKAAQKIVRDIAAEIGIEPALIASKKELTRLVRGERPDWLDGWRGSVLGRQLEAASVSISAPRG
ncbi:MAG: hypothetical protein GVY32_05995 [Gammaproteobacteria bacterium]|jgi:ribonuclease D|nr:hypothetical protein [Gammaproteobacteria bacterium]